MKFLERLAAGSADKRCKPLQLDARASDNDLVLCRCVMGLNASQRRMIPEPVPHPSSPEANWRWW